MRFLPFFYRPMRPSHWKNEHGFVLIEVAIAMIIFGLIFGPGFLAWRTHNTILKHRTTGYHQKLIFQALAQHLQINGCLPYPIWMPNETKGLSVSQNKDAQPHLQPGIVPFRALGLSMRVAKDGFGHWMTYAVDPSWTSRMYFQNQMCEKFFASPSPLDVIECGKSVQNGILENRQIYKPLMNTLGQEMGKKRFDGIAVVLVSHGREGWGSIISQGKHMPFPSDVSPYILQDSENRVIFKIPDRGASLSQSSAYTNVVWQTRAQMMSEANLSCLDYFFEKTPPTISDMERKKPGLLNAHPSPAFSSGYPAPLNAPYPASQPAQQRIFTQKFQPTLPTPSTPLKP